ETPEAAAADFDLAWRQQSKTPHGVPEVDRSEQGRNKSAVLGNTMQALTEGGVPFLQALDATLKAFDHPAPAHGVRGLGGEGYSRTDVDDAPPREEGTK